VAGAGAHEGADAIQHLIAIQAQGGFEIAQGGDLGTRTLDLCLLLRVPALSQ